MSIKINPSDIVAGHLKTLRDDRTGRVSWFDWMIFFGLPIAIGFAVWHFNQLVTNEVFNGSASVFGIFVGLLLNVQVAIFGIFLRKPEKTEDPAAQIVLQRQLARRGIVLRELNANIAYLILVCSSAIGLCVVFLGLAHNSAIYTGVVAFLYAHILLNMMMTVKRAFLLFDAEYQSP